MKKIIRTICYFEENPSRATKERLDSLSTRLLKAGFEIQTRRICSPSIDKTLDLDASYAKENYIFGIGPMRAENIQKQFNNILASKDTSFNLDLTEQEITNKEAQILFNIISKKPSKTFNFSYVFNNPPSSPFFPSSSYSQDGFSVGFQATDLSENCKTLEEWFNNMKQTWEEVFRLFKSENDFLGIDSSIAPLSQGISSLINFVKRLGYSFDNSATSDIYIEMTNFIKNNSPKPIGLCGLMLPCLEDFELAEEYEKGNFPIERNIYLSLQSGLGVDCYPIGIDEDKKRLVEILKLIQKLSNKYKKPLSARFVSDGRAKIGEKTDFKNQYLKDVMIRKL